MQNVVFGWIQQTTATLTYLQLANGLEPVDFIFPQLHVFPKNFLTLSEW